MSDSTVARQYANALFDVASAQQRTDVVARDLRAIVEVVQAHPDLAAAFQAPLVTPKQKRALVDAIVGITSDLAVEVRRLLELLADRDRLGALAAIGAAFDARLMEARRQIAAAVVSAVPLTPEREAALAAALGQVTSRRVTIQSSVDPALVGGLVARVGSLVIDASVVRQLARMRERLLADA